MRACTFYYRKITSTYRCMYLKTVYVCELLSILCNHLHTLCLRIQICAQNIEQRTNVNCFESNFNGMCQCIFLQYQYMTIPTILLTAGRQHGHLLCSDVAKHEGASGLVYCRLSECNVFYLAC